MVGLASLEGIAVRGAFPPAPRTPAGALMPRGKPPPTCPPSSQPPGVLHDEMGAAAESTCVGNAGACFRGWGLGVGGCGPPAGGVLRGCFRVRRGIENQGEPLGVNILLRDRS